MIRKDPGVIPRRMRLAISSVCILLLLIPLSGCELFCIIAIAVEETFNRNPNSSLGGLQGAGHYLDDHDVEYFSLCPRGIVFGTVSDSSDGSAPPISSNDTFEPVALPTAPNSSSNSYTPTPPLVVAGPATSGQLDAAAQSLPPNLPPSLAPLSNSIREAPVKFGGTKGAQ
jgi:hypothetical protein